MSTITGLYSRGLKRSLPKKLGAVIFSLDAFMLIAALWLSNVAGRYLSEFAGYKETFFGAHILDYPYSLLLPLFVLIWLSWKGHYSRRLPWIRQVESSSAAIFYVSFFIAASYLLREEYESSFMALVYCALCVPAFIFGRFITIHIISHSKEWRLPIVLIGNNTVIKDSFYAFYADGLTGYEVKVALLTESNDPNFDMGFLPKAHPYVDLRKDRENFDEFIKNNPQYYYIISMDELRKENSLISPLSLSRVEYGVIPHTKTLDVYGLQPQYFFGNDIMILHRRDRSQLSYGKFLKRAMDIALTGLVLPYIATLAGIVFIAKKLQGSDTPVFYGGERVGLNGKNFKCWKFCTMRRDANQVLEKILAENDQMRVEWESFQKIKNDPRIDSSISKLLRKTSLDELPQLWNVFVGDMSLVGPRPILENQKADYGEMIGQYEAVRPGLTGLWQVSGRNETTFQQRVYWDGWYIRNWSFWYDIIIILKTVKVFLKGSGAY